LNASEEALTGGNINPGVVRIGDTVRRATTPNSASIHQLLLHLEKKGFRHSPRFLGMDAKEREILTFIDGETEIPESLWQKEQALIATAKLLRVYHDATLDFERSKNMTWAIAHPDPARHEVICHNDFAPYNFIFCNELPHAVIDFDLAGPGPRLRDIAYAAYWLTPLSFGSADLQSYAEQDLQNGSHRLHLFCQAYGIPLDNELFDILAEILHFMSSESKMEEILGKEVAVRLAAEGHLAHWGNEACSFARNRTQLEANISCTCIRDMST
jgi:hypothetical protein